MGLAEYAKKRDFSKTKEPKAGKSQEKDILRFVIQKHAASHLHYDFRLEMEGVLKSWAVPKGPSTDPEIKRLAMMVEDHPYDYRSFEGIIPKGEYGGGTVIVWDEGTYEPAEFEGNKKEREKHLLQGLQKGKLKFVLHGVKLQGEFAMVKAHGRGENEWLLMKLEDEHASKKDITKQDKSVQSDKTLEQVAKTSENVWHSNRTENKKEVKKEPTPQPSPTLDVKTLLKKATKAKIPAGAQPMLATLVDGAFDDADWAYEIKWDGYRALAFVEKGAVELVSRNNKSFNEKFYSLHSLLKEWNINAVVDGEIVVLNDKGMSDFASLQNWRSEADGHLTFYVFDILWYEGKSLIDLTFVERRAILQDVLPADQDHIRLSQVFEANGTEFFEAAKEMGFEGIIAKKKSSVYQPVARSRDWLKIKTDQRQEAVIGGYTLNEDSRKKFSALLMGVFEKGEFKYIGLVGTGFSDKLQEEIVAKLAPYVTDKCPFPTVPEYNKPSRFRPKPSRATVTWVKPLVVGEVSFREMTPDGVMRHPSFKGLREDKDAKKVVKENPKPTTELVEEEAKKEVKKNEKSSLNRKDIFEAPRKSERKTLLNPTDSTQTRSIEGHSLKFNNLSKLYWPEDKISKRDMLNYYYQIAPFMVPHLKDRPQSLHRFPNGIHGMRFYQKNVVGKVPDWIETYPYETSDGEKKEMLVCCDEASLLYMASLGCIEMNPFFSRKESVEYPDYCVIDLDPDNNTFDQVIETALVTKKVLDEIGVPSFCKTSGSTGIHVYIPLGAQYSYDQSQLFAKLVVMIVHEQLPSYTTLERMISNRKGKMYLDFLQNRPGATIAGVYSVRPKPGATVSMPLHWDELKPGLKMKDFTVLNAVERVRANGDIFAGVLGEGIDLSKALGKAQEIFGS